MWHLKFHKVQGALDLDLDMGKYPADLIDLARILIWLAGFFI